jgi:hypothetical protein
MKKHKKMEATLKFQTSEQAEKFALSYSRNTCKGHTISNNIVKVYNVTDNDKKFINDYVKSLN